MSGKGDSQRRKNFSFHFSGDERIDQFGLDFHLLGHGQDLPRPFGGECAGWRFASVSTRSIFWPGLIRVRCLFIGESEAY